MFASEVLVVMKRPIIGEVSRNELCRVLRKEGGSLPGAQKSSDAQVVAMLPLSACNTIRKLRRLHASFVDGILKGFSKKPHTDDTFVFLVINSQRLYPERLTVTMRTVANRHVNTYIFVCFQSSM